MSNLVQSEGIITFVWVNPRSQIVVLEPTSASIGGVQILRLKTARVERYFAIYKTNAAIG